ncbi:MAG TPA: aminotransferase class V-fold PLP-dependent enzyme [Verrucomicrobiae bacterium]|nr:aminotransferase class V-fold PLP-dependent enzyme [Verrucomicrobiae bacterium]
MNSNSIAASAREEFPLGQPACDPKNWLLDPSVIYLNHGAFGACPKRVLEFQSEWRNHLERQPSQFLVRELEKELDSAREALARFVGAETEDLVFISNTTHGINTILRSLDFQLGDELLVTDQEYNASRNALNFAAEKSGARVVVAKIPFPFHSAEEIIAPFLENVTPRTRLAMLDHVTSSSGFLLPIERLVAELNARGVDTLVDGAHAPGMVPLNLKQLGAAYYTGNCHKWLCAPKGAAFLCVRRDKQNSIHPLAISHGANSPRTDRSRFLLEFGWMGTGDPTAWLSVPEALRFMESAMPGGWPEVMARNRALALAAREILCAALEIPEPCPREFLGSMASVPIPDNAKDAFPKQPFGEYRLQNDLLEKYKIEVPVHPCPTPSQRVLRISAQLYNSLPQYGLLAKALLAELQRDV